MYRQAGNMTDSAVAIKGRALEDLSIEHAHLSRIHEGRLALAVIALLVTAYSPGSLSVEGMLGFCAYGLYCFYLVRLPPRARKARVFQPEQWVDVITYFLVVVLSGGAESSRFAFLLFPTLLASFQSGFQRGVIVSLVSAILLICLEQFNALHPFVEVQPASPWTYLLLVIAGLLIARWADAESTIKRRLTFSHELNDLVNPGIGMEQVLSTLVGMIHRYCGTEACVLVSRDPRSGVARLFRADSHSSHPSHNHTALHEELASQFLSLEETTPVLYCREGKWRSVMRRIKAVAPGHTPCSSPRLAEIANLLETDAFASLPLRSSDRDLGRVFILSGCSSFTKRDVRFLEQILAQAALAIANRALLDELASDASRVERQKISRDLHDVTVQSYVGVKLGIEALRRKLRPGDPITADVDILQKIANEGISELRAYVGGLRTEEAETQAVPLLSGIQQQAQQFEEFYGVNVRVSADREFPAQHRLYKEITHIVSEGLSNIRRHTTSSWAIINLRKQDDRLVLELMNERSPHPADNNFFPRSIHERTKDLGGIVRVDQRADRYTVVSAELPL